MKDSLNLSTEVEEHWKLERVNNYPNYIDPECKILQTLVQ